MSISSIENGLFCVNYNQLSIEHSSHKTGWNVFFFCSLYSTKVINSIDSHKHLIPLNQFTSILSVNSIESVLLTHIIHDFRWNETHLLRAKCLRFSTQFSFTDTLTFFGNNCQQSKSRSLWIFTICKMFSIVLQVFLR